MGSHVEVVGYLRYEFTWFDNPDNFKKLIIGLSAGGGGLLLLILIGIIARVCYKKKKDKRRRRMPSGRNPYIGISTRSLASKL